MTRTCFLASVTFLFCAAAAPAQPNGDGEFVGENYSRKTYKIPMRDGAHLYTIVYYPKNVVQKYPILLTRTPYGIPPYDEDLYRYSLGPNRHFAREGYIFAYQDVRGCFMSEGKFENMRPQLGKNAGPRDVDESTDTYDTIDFLVKNVPNNSGKVGMYGISYPGFYTSAGMINAHKALKAASPQAPIADWFYDDFNHHGAFFLAHAFGFFNFFGSPRPMPTIKRTPLIGSFDTQDGYKFYLDIGPLKNVNPRYFHKKIAFWDTMAEHPNYDKFWQDRNLLPHLKNVAPAVMTVGGWFDAEDLYGTFRTYQKVEEQNPGIFNVLVVGPWAHGAWSREDASKLGDINFGSNTADFYQKNIELPFFNYYLKGKGEHKLPEAYVFETGVNKWRKYDRWPPKQTQPRSYYLSSKGRLTTEAPRDEDAFDSYVSDPAKPVPTSSRITFGMPPEYMTDDMRYASRRPDVLTYQTEELDKETTLAGPMVADIHVATSGTDSDWMVKVIDVFPDSLSVSPSGKPMGGYQMHVRSEVIRGRFRNSVEKPEPFVANQPARIKLTLQDVLHTFKKGHRIMVQVHSTWFPLVDRNPQKYVPNIFHADESDFITTMQRVYRSADRPSQLSVGVLPKEQ